MATSQGTITYQSLPKKFPFSSKKAELQPRRFDLGYHVTVLGKYSKNIPHRAPSALDRRQSVSTLKWINDTRQYNPRLYTAY